MQVNLLANTDLRSAEEFADLIVAERDGAIVRLSDVARVELGAEEAIQIAKYSEQEGVYLAVWPLVGSNELDVAQASARRDGSASAPRCPQTSQMRLVWDGTMFMRNALKEITKTLGETILIVGLAVFLFMGSIRTALVPLIAMPVSLIGAAIVMYAFGFSLNLLTMLAIVLAVGLVVDDAIVVVENVERHVRAGKSRIEAALVGARELHRADHRDDDHAGRGVCAHRLPGRPYRLAVPRVRDHARGGGDRIRHRRDHAVARHELALRARARRRRPPHEARQPRIRRRAPYVRAAARSCARRCARDRGRGRCSSRVAAWPLYHVLAAGTGARRRSEPHQPLLRSRAGRRAAATNRESLKVVARAHARSPKPNTSGRRRKPGAASAAS